MQTPVGTQITDLAGRRYDAAMSLALDGFGVVELYATFPCDCPPHSLTRGADGVCHSPGKHPVGVEWQNRWTQDADRIRAIAQNPRRQPGILPLRGSQLLVIDFDRLDVWERFRPLIPATLVVKTAKGFHVYGRLPDGVDEADVPSSFEGGEIRVNGSGQVVAPFGQHASGIVYEPLSGPLEPAVLPRDLITALQASHDAKTAAQRDAHGPEDDGWRVTEPGRHDFLKAKARNLRGVGLTGQNLRDELLRLNNERCDPPKPETEIDAVLEWVEKNITDDPWVPPLRIAGNGEVDHRQLFVNVVDYVANVPDDVPWVAKPLCYFGGVTLLAGIWKGGKSTLAAQLQRARETGELFLGWKVPIGPTALVTEEGGVPVKHKAGDLLQLDILDRRSAVLAGLDFDGLVTALRRYCETQDTRSVLFIDTFAVWGELDDENDATEVTAAISKLTNLAQDTEAAVNLVHHNRKDGGAHGRGIRGSGAIPATVDIFATLDRVDEKSDSTDRILRLEGRVIEPEIFHLEFDTETKTYSVQDADQALRDQIDTWLTKVPADGEGLAYTELTDTWGIGRGRTYDRVETLVNLGRIRQERGKRGNAKAMLHWSIPSLWLDPADRRNGDHDDGE